MTIEFVPETAAIREAFEQEVADLGGTVTDAFDDGRCLFLRSIFPGPMEVTPGDRVSRGVAPRSRESEILVHPYFFRQVCRNGSIVAQAVQTRRVERHEYATCPGAGEAVLLEVRQAVRECSDAEILAGATDRMRTMTETEADAALSLLPEILKLKPDNASRLVDIILGRFERRPDRSTFGLMNAITSVARDSPNHDTRWRLEEAGGGMLARLIPVPTPSDAAAELVLV
ncbi:MAG: hypothetical protein ACYTAU_20925 [Planctomycetota bacterium]|jgi:hypothetical protein